MSRDSNVDPIFGDVFEINTGYRTYRAMFVNSISNGEWRGVQLDVTRGPRLSFVDTGDLRIFVTTASWKFVEHIGELQPVRGLSPLAGLLSRMSDAEYESTFGRARPAKAAIHHIDGNPTNNDPANLVELPWGSR